MSYTRLDIIEPCYAEFGEWVATQRKSLGLVQAEVADLLGMTRGSVANIEGGNQRVLYHQVLLLKEALASKEGFEAAIANRARAAEDMILLKAAQIQRQRDTDRSGEADETAKQAQPVRARAGAAESGIAQPTSPGETR